MTMTKKALIAGAFLTAAGIAGTATAGAPVVYGKANISVQSNDFENGQEDNVTINSNASRLGVKGKHKLSDNLSAFYKAEYEIYFDDKDSAKNGSDFGLRNIYAGVMGNFGAVRVGRFDTPVKKAQGKVDLFNDLKLGDIKTVVDNVYDADDRGSNMIQYDSPKFNDMQVKVAIFAGEEDETTNPGDARDGVADGYQASVTYKAGDIYAALAYGDSHSRAEEDMSVLRAVGQYAVSESTKLGLLLQTADAGNGGAESTSVVFSVAHKVGKNTFKAQWGQEDLDNAPDKVSQFNLGVDHKLNKKTKVYAYYGQATEDDGTDEEKDSTLGLGMEVKF